MNGNPGLDPRTVAAQLTSEQIVGSSGLEPRVVAEALEHEPLPVKPEEVAAQSIQIWATRSEDGYLVLNWRNTGAVGQFDYVALFVNPPADPHGYLTNQWQWATRGTSYKTGTSYASTYWLAYISWDYAAGAYKILSTVRVHRIRSILPR